MYEEDEDLLEDVIIEYRQAIEMVEMYSHILNGMLEIFRFHYFQQSESGYAFTGFYNDNFSRANNAFQFGE